MGNFSPVGATMSESLSSVPVEPIAPAPLPARPRAPVSLVVLATLAVAFTLWAAQPVVLPILLAMFFALVGNPILRMLERIWVPRALGAILVIVVGLGATTALAVQLVVPTMEWAQEAPQQLRKIGRELRTRGRR